MEKMTVNMSGIQVKSTRWDSRNLAGPTDWANSFYGLGYDLSFFFSSLTVWNCVFLRKL